MGKRDKRRKGTSSTNAPVAIASESQLERELQRSQKQTKKGKRKAEVLDLSTDEEDVVTALAAYEPKVQEVDQEMKEIQVEQGPSPRANATLMALPPLPGVLSSPHLLLFGGEYYNGKKCTFFNDLFLFHCEKRTWTQWHSVLAPAPRSAHQMVVTPSGLAFLFGGEFSSANESQFYHHKDFWCLDLKQRQWMKVDVKVRPTPRSGHRMVLWKHFIVLFGGFYDTYVETRYMDDIWIFNTETFEWMKLMLPDSMAKPGARSAFQFISLSDGIHLYGGFCKRIQPGGKEAQGYVYDDTWFLHMDTDLSKVHWERKKKGVQQPTARSGFVAVSEREKIYAFGGIQDEKACDALFLYLPLQHKWFPLRYQKESGLCARYNPMMAIQKHVLYLLGGLQEQGKQRTLTLDDFYCFPLEKPNQIQVLRESTADQRPWLGEEDDSSSESDSHSNSEADADDSDSESSSVSDEEEQATSSLPNEPRTGETLAQFYARTLDYWTEKAVGHAESAVPSAKTLRRDAFAMARECFETAMKSLNLENESSDEDIQMPLRMDQKQRQRRA